METINDRFNCFVFIMYSVQWDGQHGTTHSSRILHQQPEPPLSELIVLHNLIKQACLLATCYIHCSSEISSAPLCVVDCGRFSRTFKNINTVATSQQVTPLFLMSILRHTSRLLWLPWLCLLCFLLWSASCFALCYIMLFHVKIHREHALLSLGFSDYIFNYTYLTIFDFKLKLNKWSSKQTGQGKINLNYRKGQGPGLRERLMLCTLKIRSKFEE